MYPRSPQKELTSDSGSKALSWLRSSCLPLFQLLPLLFVDWKPSCELPGSSKATRRVEDNVFQRVPRPAPASSPEMLQIGEKPPTESQDRCGAGAGSCGRSPAGAFLFIWPWTNLTCSVGLSFPLCSGTNHPSVQLPSCTRPCLGQRSSAHNKDQDLLRKMEMLGEAPMICSSWPCLSL